MAKQSPKDPKFRCNICKEYYYAPEHLVHYQCPDHGYLCSKHIFKKSDLLYYCRSEDNPNNSNGQDPKNDLYYDLVFELNQDWFGKCCIDSEGKNFKNLSYSCYHVYDKLSDSTQEYNFDERWKNGGIYSNITRQEFTEKLSLSQKLIRCSYKEPCTKTPAKFLWNENIKRWLEEGKEIEEDFLKEMKTTKIINKPSNYEIKLLVELFEKNVLTRDQFLEQIKQKI
ncbi:MAG: hypothetical protein NT104_04725 [Bacteroidetes bacterium]|nr:hypothetical protein [Bacteroidota bacterium]